jgi:hypothetical protein
MSIHNTPGTLAKALGKANEKITAVTYEHPYHWLIQTKKEFYRLGTANETVGWCDDVNGELWEELEGSDENTAPETIAKAFSAWLDKVEAN